MFGFIENFTDSQTNAQCTGAGTFKTGFDGYINNCLKTQDIQSLKNLFDGLNLYSSDKRNELDLTNKEILDNSYTEAIKLGDTLYDIGYGKAGSSSQRQLLVKEKQELAATFQTLNQQAQSADRTFLDTLIEKEQPQYETFPSLQDASLAIFWIGWLIMGVVLVLGKFIGIDGSTRTGVIVFVLYILVSVLVYGILKKVA